MVADGKDRGGVRANLLPMGGAPYNEFRRLELRDLTEEVADKEEEDDEDEETSFLEKMDRSSSSVVTTVSALILEFL